MAARFSKHRIQFWALVSVSILLPTFSPCLGLETKTEVTGVFIELQDQGGNTVRLGAFKGAQDSRAIEDESAPPSMGALNFYALRDNAKLEADYLSWAPGKSYTWQLELKRSTSSNTLLVKSQSLPKGFKGWIKIDGRMQELDQIGLNIPLAKSANPLFEILVTNQAKNPSLNPNLSPVKTKSFLQGDVEFTPSRSRFCKALFLGRQF